MSLLPAHETEPVERPVAPRPHPPKRLAEIPRGYALDRVGAAAIDPDRLYVYWELTDFAIARARAELGEGGKDAWLNLRVHDTSGRIFDGTNAHAYTDQGVQRSDRQWFFVVGRPTSTAVVEVGLKTAEGDFARIARSGRVEFPRTAPASSSEPEWMTVRASGEVEHEGIGYRRRSDVDVRPQPPHPPPHAPAQAPHDDFRRGHAIDTGGERSEGPTAWHELPVRHADGESLRVMTTWHAGPFAYPVEVEPPSSYAWREPTRTYRVGNVTYVLEGVWHVVIRNLGARGERQTFGHWEIRRSWATAGGEESRHAGPRAPWPGASEQLALGASERRWAAGSELRLGGASERWHLGASELRLGGASERLFAGASEWALQGASEQRFHGTSELRLGGSERRLAPSSASPYPDLRREAP